MMLSREECNLRQIDLEAVQNEVKKATESKKKRGAYFVYSPEECFNIAKYAEDLIKTCLPFQKEISFIEWKHCPYVQG